MKNLFLVIGDPNGTKGISSAEVSIVGPFIHWQAAADWLDLNPHIRDVYSYVLVSDLVATSSEAIEKINDQYRS